MTCSYCYGDIPINDFINISFADNGERVEKECGYVYIHPEIPVCSIPCLYGIADTLNKDRKYNLAHSMLGVLWNGTNNSD